MAGWGIALALQFHISRGGMWGWMDGDGEGGEIRKSDTLGPYCKGPGVLTQEFEYHTVSCQKYTGRLLISLD